MPEMSGWEATEKIRGLYGQKPFIAALTASAFPHERKRCLDAGMDIVVSKPVQLADLEGAVDLAVARLACTHGAETANISA